MTTITDAIPKPGVYLDENGYPAVAIVMDLGSAWQALNALLRQEAFAEGLHLTKTRSAIAAIRSAADWPEGEGEARALGGNR